MNSLIAFFASLFTPDNIKELVGITFMVLWAWSEKLSFNPNTPANGVLQKIAPDREATSNNARSAGPADQDATPTSSGSRRAHRAAIARDHRDVTPACRQAEDDWHLENQNDFFS